jgi:glutathione synthase/RimK-type ligase-like ATP-grasp enzyme
MKVNNYFFAGLDFIFDKNNNLWFLEANYAPHGAKNIKRLYGKEEITKELAKVMKKEGGEKCCLMSRYLGSKSENSIWFTNEMAKHIPDMRRCFSDENSKRVGKLKDTDGKFFKPDVICRYNRPLTSSFEKRLLVINSNKVKKTVNNKMLTLKIVDNVGINVPKTFYIKDTKQLVDLVAKKKKLFKHGFVIKPIDESQGRGVYVLKKGDNVPEIYRKEILEERIIPKLQHKHYWDVRVFVVNGKFLGGEMRSSTHRVTNVSRGGKSMKLPKKLYSLLKRPSLKIVKAIDDHCE